MDEPQPGGLLDRAVDLLARALDALGFNGSRLRWRWRQHRLRAAETGARASSFLRSARAQHKMCPSCRSLVPRGARACPDCGESLAGVSTPGTGRLLANVFPGAMSVTSLLLLVNGLLFVLMLMNTVRDGGEGGLLSFGLPVIVRYGAAGAIPAFQFGEWWRLATAVFLHGGLIHFGFNSYVLLQIGPIVEQEYGHERYWVCYLLTGILGNLLHSLVDPRGIVVGASGAICGLVGLLIAYGSRVGTPAGRNLKSAMMQFAVMILIVSFLPGISWQAHLGGFLVGLGLGYAIPTGPFRSRATATLWQALSLAGVLLVLFCFYKVAVVA